MTTPAQIRLLMGLTEAAYTDDRLAAVIDLAQEQADNAGVSSNYSAAIADQITMFLTLHNLSQFASLDPALGAVDALEAGSVKLALPEGGGRWRARLVALDTKNLLGLGLAQFRVLSARGT